MHSFKDENGKVWLVRIDVAAIKRVKATLELDLMEAAGGDLLPRLAGDPILLCDVLYVICRKDAGDAGIDDEQFGRLMAGDTIEHATEALLEELCDFFPKARRDLLRNALGKVREFETLRIQTAHETLNSSEMKKMLTEEALRRPTIEPARNKSEEWSGPDHLSLVGTD